MQMVNRRRHLFTAGILLFLITMLYGTIFPSLPNPRIGVSGHLVGLFGGLFLIGLGALWGELALKPGLEKAVVCLGVFGTYGSFSTNILAAIFSTNRLTPLFGSGHFAQPWQENIVTFGLLSGSGAMVICCVIVLWGLHRRGKEPLIAGGEGHG